MSYTYDFTTLQDRQTSYKQPPSGNFPNKHNKDHNKRSRSTMASIRLPSSVSSRRVSTATVATDAPEAGADSPRTTEASDSAEPVTDIDWATLKKSEDHEQLETPQAPVDKGFLRQRLESRSKSCRNQLNRLMCA